MNSGCSNGKQGVDVMSARKRWKRSIKTINDYSKAGKKRHEKLTTNDRKEM